MWVESEWRTPLSRNDWSRLKHGWVEWGLFHPEIQKWRDARVISTSPPVALLPSAASMYSVLKQ